MRKNQDPKSPGYTNALLESIEDKFQIVVEATQGIPRVEEKLDATFEEVGKLRVDVDVLNVALSDIHSRLDVTEQAMKLLSKNTSEIDELRDRVETVESMISAK